MEILRKNWKKTVLSSLFLGSGFVFLKSEYEIEEHMREVCNNVAKYEEEEQSRGHILAILNPVSNHKNTIKLFRNYCEPILHSAGLRIESVKTCYTGHAKSLIENLDAIPAAIIVAGGEGTASDVVTGLMRNGKAICPVAILPLGSSHNMPHLFGRLEFVKRLTNSIISVVRGNTEFENLIKYDLIEENNLNHKSIYGLNCFKWGVCREIDVLKDKYWYFGVFKRYAAIFFNAFSDDLSWKCSADLIFSTPCKGCSNCYRTSIATLLTIPNFSKSKNGGKIINSLNINYCNKNVCHVETSNLTVTPQFQSDNTTTLLITSFPKQFPGFHSLKNLLELNNKEADKNFKITSHAIDIIPTSSFRGKFFYIDGEEYEVCPIKIAILPKAIQVFK